MDFQYWLMFSAAVLGATLIPGPAVLLSLTHGVRFGASLALFTVAGIIASAAIQAGIAMAGLGAVLAASAGLFSVVKLAGAIYLVHVGIGLLRTGGGIMCEDQAEAVPAVKRSQLFRQGLFVGLSNPKAIIFFTSLFPQFMNPRTDGPAQMAAMLASVVVFGFAGTMAYAMGGHGLMNFFKRPRVRSRFNKTSGAVFVASGIGLALAEK